MPVAVYGHYGFALLLVPTAAADYLEYERFQLLDHIAPYVEAGVVKVFSIDSINKHAWMDRELPETVSVDRIMKVVGQIESMACGPLKPRKQGTA